MQHHKRYPTVYRPQDPLAMSSGNLYLHRFLAEMAIGRVLPPKVVVHHHTSSRTGGLVICENQAYHLLLHLRTKAYKATGHANWLKCVRCKKWDDPLNLKVYKSKNRAIGDAVHAKCAARSSIHYRRAHLVQPETRRKNLVQIVKAGMFCVHGHPFNDENTHIDKTGSRRCRECNRERTQIWRKSKWDPRTRTEGPVV